ncbi:ribosomal protein L17 [Neorickettsia helminthoeca str. Oregon]|uniref:Large ribosomal subunit protein bL17 n=1 Tax=Neorickettsia helminthoeca str. Oregon TaxID=1286528 RepID=X5GVX9_9RICK|nr:50S ribosomal protein L17 [Neorickettsia helminthoeca]AHX11232.1 ribosomal protein L17 [Neorickettsia helminthoeca str. Oregon]
MKHRVKKHRLARNSSHRMALMCNLSIALITHGCISTTLAKAKALRPFIEKLVTKARSSSLSSRRLLISRIKNEVAVSKLIDEVAKKYLDRPGGYCRIMKNGYRAGDAAPMAVIEFV